MPFEACNFYLRAAREHPRHRIHAQYEVAKRGVERSFCFTHAVAVAGKGRADCHHCCVLLSGYLTSSFEQHTQVVLGTSQGRVEAQGMHIGLLRLLILAPAMVKHS
ncbi:hypothetical protein E2C01_011072 [Portunus trituberculatus]|uniref:Uncharacterized protein n=1 Tax=Portunus trituberculatus TaxID=210409 RepID=A0A5B7DAK0_PORTR|nr:hypothetical protein [Portunus trituberculatus]